MLFVIKPVTNRITGGFSPLQFLINQNVWTLEKLMGVQMGHVNGPEDVNGPDQHLCLKRHHKHS